MSKLKRDQDDLSEQFKAWNPMQEDYTNSKFNQYCSGPGAHLDPALQPSEVAKQSKQSQQLNKHGGHNNGGVVPYLVFKNVPAGMTKNALYNVCSSNGKVKCVRDSNKNDYYFVDFERVADMEAVYSALEKNTFGFKVYVGKQFKEMCKDKHIEKNENHPAVLARNNGIDIENRKYRASSLNHPRPEFNRKSIVTAKDYNSDKNLLMENDPQRHFLIEEDAHDLERAGLMKPNVEMGLNAKYSYRTGSAYITMPKATQNFIQSKSKESVGTFDVVSQLFRNENTEGKKQQLNCGACVACKCICDTICSRCSAYFCGLECQRKAWPEHRHVCGKPKHLIDRYAEIKIEQNLPSANAKPKTQLGVNMPRSGNLITISAVSKSNVVFIRSKTFEDNLLFFNTISAIQADARNLKPLRTVPQYGQIVVAQFQDDTGEVRFNRAMILNLEDLNNIKLVYIDYGNLDSRPFDELYAAPSYYSELPRLAIPVILKDVPDVYMTETIRKFMYSYLDALDLQVKYDADADFIEGKSVHQVELIDALTSQSFNKIICQLAKPVEPLLSEDIIHLNHLEHKLLPKGEHLELVIMDNSLLCTGCISCTTREYALQIQRFEKDIQEYANSLEQQNYAPRVDELCIAKYSVNEMWYRGRCLDLVGDGHPTIVFFDYGNIDYVNIKDIRRYPPQFTYPIFTSDCEIKGLPELCEEKLVSKLEELLPNGTVIKCDSIEVFEEDKFHVITLNEVEAALRADGLLDEIKVTEAAP